MLRQARSTVVRATLAVSATTLALELTTRLPTQGRSSDLYRTLSDEVALPLARTMLDAETAHNLAVEMTRRGFGPVYRDRGGPRGYGGGKVGGRRAGMSVSPFSSSSSASSEMGKKRPIKLKPLVFPNPVGLAAGFDKDAIAIDGMFALGFGSVEVGTVTPKPQPGNPKPRMWRLVEDRGAINRYGFNSKGMEEVERNLRRFRGIVEIGGDGEESEARAEEAEAEITEPTEPTAVDRVESILSASSRTILSALRSVNLLPPPTPPPPAGILGVNLGKNKSTPDDDALNDYAALIRRLGPYADYLVVNVSSPNTPGLRGLQRRDALRDLLRGALRERDALADSSDGRGGGSGGGDDGEEGAVVEVPPLLVKIAPDLSPSEMEDVAAVAMEVGVDGIVVSNTSTSRPPALASANASKPGGLSGAPIRDLSTEAVRSMFALTDGRIPIVGVGGVGSGHDAYEKMKAGASLVQVYTMMVYDGPGMVGRIRDELEEILVRNGHRDAEDAVGADHGAIYWRRREERARREAEEAI